MNIISVLNRHPAITRRLSSEFPVSTIYTPASTSWPVQFSLTWYASLSFPLVFPTFQDKCKPYSFQDVLLQPILISSFLWKLLIVNYQQIFIIINSQASYLCNPDKAGILQWPWFLHDTSEQNSKLGSISPKQIRLYKALINIQNLLKTVLRNGRSGYIRQKSISNHHEAPRFLRLRLLAACSPLTPHFSLQPLQFFSTMFFGFQDDPPPFPNVSHAPFQLSLCFHRPIFSLSIFILYSHVLAQPIKAEFALFRIIENGV